MMDRESRTGLTFLAAMALFAGGFGIGSCGGTDTYADKKVVVVKHQTGCQSTVVKLDTGKYATITGGHHGAVGETLYVARKDRTWKVAR